jgi:hypothetical protein
MASGLLIRNEPNAFYDDYFVGVSYQERDQAFLSQLLVVKAPTIIKTMVRLS